MTETRIIGVSLVRNEDVFVEQALRNVLGFCDEVIVLDHRSRDRTRSILAEVARAEPKVRVHSIRHPRESHDFVSPYAGSPTWMLGVDGDELHDPERLRALRERILAGELDRWWTVAGNILHVRSLDREASTASGYLTPPSRGLAKLKNFGALESWEGPARERFHGGDLRFRPGYGHHLRYELFHEHSWEDSPFRWLHVCFLPRSSRQPRWTKVRPNPSEIYSGRVWRTRIRRGLATLQGRPYGVGKLDAFTKGDVVTVPVGSFFSG